MERSAATEILRLWQLQEREEQIMPLDDIRTKAQHLDARTRRSQFVTGALCLLLVIVEGWQVWRGVDPLERTGDLLTIAAFVYVAYRFRKFRLAAPPIALGRTNGADFCRAELLRQRDLSKDSWGYLLPFVPGVALALVAGGVPSRPASQTIALVAAGVTLFLGIAWWNAYVARRLQNEIDALDA
jgi:hypothetical protein